MIEYKDPRAYETIQQVVIDSLADMLDKTAQEIQIIIIVGAYWGCEINSLLARYPNSQVYAFEAHPHHYKVLVDGFKNQERVHCFNSIILDKEGDVMFYELTEPGNGSVLKFKDDGHNHIAASFLVESIRLDTFMAKSLIKGVDLLWVDVQGAELSVMKSVDLNIVESLFLEVTTHREIYEGNCYLHELEDYLQPIHYLYSIGLDHESESGTGNSFWLKVKDKL